MRRPAPLRGAPGPNNLPSPIEPVPGATVEVEMALHPNPRDPGLGLGPAQALAPAPLAGTSPASMRINVRPAGYAANAARAQTQGTESNEHQFSYSMR